MYSMAQNTESQVLASAYDQQIGTATNSNEVMGYWIYLIGTIFGVLGVLTFALTAPATMIRGFGYALLALSPAMVLAGATLRFPLQRFATTLVIGGLTLTLGAVAWFLVTFPSGWSLTTGHTGVIALYTVGLSTIGIAATVVPLVVDTEEIDEANEQARRSDQETVMLREKNQILSEKVSELEGIADDDHDILSSKADFEMYKDSDDQWRWRLLHDNGNIIADSGEGYSSKQNARKGLESVKLNAIGADIVEL